MAIFKAACKKIKGKYKLQNIGYSEWLLETDAAKPFSKVVRIEKRDIIIKYKFDKEIGAGKYSVYAYYYDIYRNYALICGDKFFV